MKSIIEDKTKRTILILVSVAVILAIGGTYAWLQDSVPGKKNNVIRSGTLSLKLDESASAGINLSNTYPMTDAEGLNTTVYTFKLVNDGTMNSNYEIYLDDLELAEGKVMMDSNMIKYRLKKGEEETIDTLGKLGQSPNRLLDSGVINSKESISYELQVWMDYNAGNDQQATSFSSQLRVEGSQITE